MSEESETATRYRLHAEELRAIAHEKDMGRCRKSLIKVARDYERMAGTLEAIDETNRTLEAKRGYPAQLCSSIMLPDVPV